MLSNRQIESFDEGGIDLPAGSFEKLLKNPTGQ